MKTIYIDTETTGLNNRTCAIWQLAGIIKDGSVTEEFNFLIAPHEKADFTTFKYEDLKTPSKEVMLSYTPHTEIYKQFISLLDKYVDRYDSSDKFHVIGYNVQFDVDFLRNFFARNNDEYFGSWFWHPPIDVMYLASAVLAGERSLLPNFRLSSVYEYVFNETFPDAHDAMADIKATEKLLNELFRRLKS
jgi:DNA polymerase-3 subunit epsilon